MFIVTEKKPNNKIPKKVKEFKDYQKAYSFVGHTIWKRDESLHWSYSLKYLQSGYSKLKIFQFGDFKVKRDGFEYIIKQKIK
jgi:hypothetical protein